MSENIDHDRLFKELISTFFVEFIELFFPQVMTYLDSESVTFLDKEIFTDVTEGEKYETDLIAQVKFQRQSSFFLAAWFKDTTPNILSLVMCYLK